MSGFETQFSQPLDRQQLNQNGPLPSFDATSLLQDGSILPTQNIGEQHLPGLIIDQPQNGPMNPSDHSPNNPGDSPANPRGNDQTPPACDSPGYVKPGFVDAPPADQLLNGNNNVILIGDCHDDKNAKSMVTNMMAQIQSLDPNSDHKPSLVLEPMPENLQQSINHLDPNNPNPETMGQIKDCLKNSIQPVPSNDVIQSYMDMVIAARKAGVEIICPEPKLPQDPQLFSKEFGDVAKDSNLRTPLQDYLNNSDPEQAGSAKDALEASLKKNNYSDDQIKQFFDGLEPMRHPPIQLPESMDSKSFGDTLNKWRNVRYVDAVNEQLSQGQNVIVFAGFKHFGHQEDGTIEEALDGQSGIRMKRYGYQTG